ncbi:HipA domain-containing protein [Bacillus sp. S3]|uniref:HipA family kinase n=1 Tax=Bacillus sp. S3 TaxID=486398 RepID=UPI001187F532|nr:HipA family kinase [Bacillus sp. S3]QCJ42441.1 HipA domain-containing protein [Bacillus sp. S3]
MMTPVAYQKKLEGKSNAHLITFNDGKDYVVKFFQPGFEKTLPNEWVGYCLARYLGLPVPFARIVDISEEFTSLVPELAKVQSTRYQFASLYIPDCLNGHQVSEVANIVNHQTLAGIVMLDYWLCNRDRTRKNILLRERESDEYQLWMIDQAEIFGTYNWLHADLENLPVEVLKSATHQLMAGFIDNEQRFTDHLKLIQTMPILLMEEIVSLIPDDWMVSREEKKAIVTTLVTRRKTILPKLMERFLKKVYQPFHANEN